MAMRTGKGYLKGQTRKRSQCYNSKTDTHIVRDTTNGQFIRGGKKSPYKNVRKE